MCIWESEQWDKFKTVRLIWLAYESQDSETSKRDRVVKLVYESQWDKWMSQGSETMILV